MVKRGRPPAPAAERPPEPTLEEAIEQEKSDNRRLETEEWLSEFRERFTDQPATVLVEKFDDNEWAICRRYALSTFDYESVLNEFGGGTYRATLIGPDGRYVKEGRTRFKFATPVLKPSIVPAAPTNPLENPVVAMMIEAQKAQNAQMLEITRSMIAAGGAGGGKSDVGQLITGLKALQDLAPKDKPLDSFKDTLNMMKLVKEVTGEGDGKGGLLSEIRQFLEVYPAIKEQLSTIKPALPPPAVASAGAPVTVTTPERSPTPLDPLSQKIVNLVPKYVKAGKESKPLVEWGKNLLDDFDTEILPLLLPVWRNQYGPLVKDEDDVYDVLLRYAEDPKEVEKIFKEIPPLAPYKEWCTRVIAEACRQAITEPPEGADVVVDAVTGNGRTPPAA